MSPPPILLVATTNPGKLREIRDALAGAAVELRSLDTCPPVAEPEETGRTFADNARLKALYYASRFGLLTVAEDSGLSIDALSGEPGVRSARYVSPTASYEERFAEIQRRLSGVPVAARTGRFECVLAVAREGEILYEATGSIEGLIATEPRGSQGFGYDPLFFFPPYNATLAEVSAGEKLRVSHRGQAFRALREWLATNSGGSMLDGSVTQTP